MVTFRERIDQRRRQRSRSGCYSIVKTNDTSKAFKFHLPQMFLTFLCIAPVSGDCNKEATSMPKLYVVEIHYVLFLKRLLTV